MVNEVWTNILDLETLFVWEIAGSELVFVFLSIAAVVMLGAYCRMPNNVIFMIVILYMLILSVILLPAIFPLTLLLIAVFFGWQVIRLFRSS